MGFKEKVWCLLPFFSLLLLFFSPLSRLKGVGQRQLCAQLSGHWSRFAAAHFPWAAFMKLLPQRLSTQITGNNCVYYLFAKRKSKVAHFSILPSTPTTWQATERRVHEGNGVKRTSWGGWTQTVLAECAAVGWVPVAGQEALRPTSHFCKPNKQTNYTLMKSQTTASNLRGKKCKINAIKGF